MVFISVGINVRLLRDRNRERERKRDGDVGEGGEGGVETDLGGEAEWEGGEGKGRESGRDGESDNFVYPILPVCFGGDT